MVGLEEEEEEKGMRKKGRGCQRGRSEGGGSRHKIARFIGRLEGGR